MNVKSLIGKKKKRGLFIFFYKSVMNTEKNKWKISFFHRFFFLSCFYFLFVLFFIFFCFCCCICFIFFLHLKFISAWNYFCIFIFFLVFFLLFFLYCVLFVSTSVYNARLNRIHLSCFLNRYAYLYQKKFRKNTKNMEEKNQWNL